MSSRTYAAKVRLVLDVSVQSAWGPDCTISQIERQAIQSARDQVESALSKTPTVISSVRATGEVLKVEIFAPKRTP